MELTPAQKAVETRKKHRETQKRRDAEKKELKAKIKGSLLSILENEQASPEEKLEASKLLMQFI